MDVQVISLTKRGYFCISEKFKINVFLEGFYGNRRSLFSSDRDSKGR